MKKFTFLMLATLLAVSGCGGGGGGGGISSIGQQKPVADAGTDETVPVNVPVQMDGSGSFSPSGRLLTYQWTLFARPPGSASALNNVTVVNPTFTPDVTGAYVLRLVVNDGVSSSDNSSVTITAVAGNIAPVADAGPDQIVGFPVSVVQLDGSGSRDPNGDPIAYSWKTLSRPAGSNPALSGLTYTDRALTDFTPDAAGIYVFGLIVTDNNGLSSGEDNVTVDVQAGNVPPVADAGPDRKVATGDAVTLDGSQSRGLNGFPLAYSWSMISRPSGSGATLSNPNTYQATFTADVSGSYVFALVVNDGIAASDPSIVTVSADRLASLSVTPLDCVTTLGFSVQYSAIGTYEIASQKVDLTDNVVWSSDHPSIATIDGTGFAVTVSEGVTVIRASHSNVPPVATTLRVGQVTLQSLAITNGDPVSLKNGQKIQLQLLGQYSDGSIVDLTDLATWTASFGGISVINVNDSYQKGLVTAVGTGTGEVLATYLGKEDRITVIVTN